MIRRQTKDGIEVNGMSAKVVVAVDDRLHESLCRLATRARKPLATYVREHLREFVGEEGRVNPP